MKRAKKHGEAELGLGQVAPQAEASAQARAFKPLAQAVVQQVNLPSESQLKIRKMAPLSQYTVIVSMFFSRILIEPQYTHSSLHFLVHYPYITPTSSSSGPLKPLETEAPVGIFQIFREVATKAGLELLIGSSSSYDLKSKLLKGGYIDPKP